MRLIYNSDAQRLQKNFDDKTPVTVSELFRSERTASVPIELFLVDNDGGYATPGSSDYEVLIGRQAQAVTTGKLTLTFTGTTEEIDLSKPKLATRIEAALNAVSEVNAAGGVDVVELKNGRAFQITFRSVGSRAAITAGVKDSMQPASVLISEVTAGTGSTREVQLLTLEEASLAEISTSGWSANSNPTLTITTLVEGTANTREVVQLSVSNDPAPGSFFVVSNSEPISTEATAAQVKTILNSALSNDIGSVKKTGERIWQITYKTNGDKTALSAGTHNLVKRPSVNATLSLNTTALAYAANSDGSDLSVGFTLKKSNEVLLSENVDLAEPFAEVIGSSAMLNNDSLGALFTIAGDDVNKGTAISLSGGLTYSSDTLAAPFLPLAGGTMTGALNLGDNINAQFGDSQQLKIYHNGANNGFIENSTAYLVLESSNIILRNTAGNEDYAKFLGDGAVELYYNNSKKFETTSLGATISGKLIVNGDLDVSGTTTTFNSTVVTVDDPVFTVGGDTAPVASDNKDRGIEFRYFRSGESAKVGFFGYSNADDAFKLLTSATNNSEVFSGTLADLNVGNVLHGDGTAAAPSISFFNDSDTGFYHAGGAINVSFNTQQRWHWTSDFFRGAATLSAEISSQAGSASSPNYRFRDDNNTGIFRADADTLAFTTGGTEAARFDSSGRLGISTDNPSHKLNISVSDSDDGIVLQKAGSSNDLFKFSMDGTTDKAELFQYSQGNVIFAVRPNNFGYINTGQNFGIGTTSPSTILEISGSGAGAAGLDLSQGESSSISNRLFFTNATASEGIALYNLSGTLIFSTGAQPANTSGDARMHLNSTGLGIGGTPSEKLTVDGNIRINGDNKELYFSGNQAKFRTSSASSDVIFETGTTELLRLDGSASSINVPDNITFKVGTGGLGIFHNDNNETWNYYSSASGTAIFSHAANDQDFVFKTTTGGTTSEVLRLDGSASSVLVGTSSVGNSAFNLEVKSGLAIQDSVGGSQDYHCKLDTSNDTGRLRLNNGTNFGLIMRGVANNPEIGAFATSGAIKFMAYTNSGGTAGSEVARLDVSTGRLGLGTTSPDSKIEISGTDSSTTDTFGLKISNEDITTNSNGGILFKNYDNHGAWIRSIRTGSANGKLSFGTNSGAGIAESNISERMVIDHNGNVGIGTTSPSAVLHVSGGSATIPSISTSFPFVVSNSTNSGLCILTGDTTSAGQLVFGDTDASVVGRIRYQHSDNSFRFWTNFAERMRIDSSGNVGIGTISPDGVLMIQKDQTAATKLIISNGGTANANTSCRLSFYEGSSEKNYIERRRDGSGKFAFVSPADDNPFVFENASGEFLRLVNGNVGIGTTAPSANADLTLGGGELCMAETTTPTADANFGKIYCKSDNKLYFQDGAGTEHEIAFV